ncbi:hypothetical protein GW17_00028400 [Ensete ventricosum]|nr:hypothetical protein GW17_00028400 [Ensete ventricosum]
MLPRGPAVVTSRRTRRMGIRLIGEGFAPSNTISPHTHTAISPKVAVPPASLHPSIGLCSCHKSRKHSSPSSVRMVGGEGGGGNGREDRVAAARVPYGDGAGKNREEKVGGGRPVCVPAAAGAAAGPNPRPCRLTSTSLPLPLERKERLGGEKAPKYILVPDCGLPVNIVDCGLLRLWSHKWVSRAGFATFSALCLRTQLSVSLLLTVSLAYGEPISTLCKDRKVYARNPSRR